MVPQPGIELMWKSAAFVTLLAACLGSAPDQARSQVGPGGYPSGIIRIVVPYPPGGTTDAAARTLADALAPLLGQPVIVENKGGAGGTIASASVAHATPDGHTLFFADVGPIAIGRSIYPNLTYDSIRDLAPVSLAVNSFLNLTVPPQHPAKSVAEFIAIARAQPRTVTYASAGFGTIIHMAGELFAMQAGIELLHVPYRGGGPAVTAVLSGDVHSAFNQLAPTIPFLRTGQMRSLGVSSLTPSPLAPELPTIASQGLPDFEVSSWQGVFAPGRTPQPIIDFLNQKLVQVLQTPATVQRLQAQGFEVLSSTPAEFAAVVRRDAEKWERVVRERRIRPE